VTKDSRLLGKWSCVIGSEVTDVSNKPVAFILKEAIRTRRFQELVHLTLENISNTLETLSSVD